jgi:ABC-type sugar transport system substrate-binding protein
VGLLEIRGIKKRFGEWTHACEMAATVAQQPKEMDRLAVEKAAELAKGGMVRGRRNFIPVALKLVTDTSANDTAQCECGHPTGAPGFAGNARF